jgi:hypothetical protein
LSGGLIPRRIDQGVLGDLVEFVLQSPVVVDPTLAFFRLLLADGLGSTLARDEARPTIVSTVELCRTGFASTVGLAALAFGGGDGAGKNGAFGLNGDGGGSGYCGA